MEKSFSTPETSTVLTPADLLAHWQGHRSLTRRVIEAFPEKELFEYSIGGMRSFAGLVKEFLAIAVPGLKEITGSENREFKEDVDFGNSKAKMLELWDEATAEINRLWSLIPAEKFQENIRLFGQYEGTVWSNIYYFIDNEIHHRGQGYVYLRSLGIQPPYFWER